MKQTSEPPKTYQDFIKRFPKLEEAWENIAAAGKSGPLDEKTQRLVKLGVAIGAMREGPVHAGVRKALALGLTEEELEQVVALAAGTIGLPATVAIFSWVQDVLSARQA